LIDLKLAALVLFLFDFL